MMQAMDVDQGSRIVQRRGRDTAIVLRVLTREVVIVGGRYRVLLRVANPDGSEFGLDLPAGHLVQVVPADTTAVHADAGRLLWARTRHGFRCLAGRWCREVSVSEDTAKRHAAVHK